MNTIFHSFFSVIMDIARVAPMGWEAGWVGTANLSSSRLFWWLRASCSRRTGRWWESGWQVVTWSATAVFGERNPLAQSCIRGLPHHFPQFKEHGTWTTQEGSRQFDRVLPMLRSLLFLLFFSCPLFFFYFVLPLILFFLSTYFGKHIVFICPFSSYPLIFDVCIWFKIQTELISLTPSPQIQGS